jgi:fructosamine-3-kinase
MLPPSLTPTVTAALRETGDTTAVLRLEPVRGGCVSKSWRLVTRCRSYFLKWNERPLPGMFSAETYGLNLLRQGGVRVPTVLAAADVKEKVPGFCLQEWTEARFGEAYRWRLGSAFGAKIAALHLASATERPVSGYGLDHDNYLGSRKQPNGWDDDWVRFFRERRLLPQVERAGSKGLLTLWRRRALEHVMERLDQWLGGVERRPALLHGDLHGRNVLCDRSGEPVLIDPAVYYGDREAEIAYTHLFGDFPPGFYAAYREVWPLASGFSDRRDLYNLYYLLNCLNAGAGHYLPRIDGILRRYIGSGL